MTESSPAPSVSVIVPVRNAARTLPHCLTALSELDPAPEEILLIDNGSTDDSLTILREFETAAMPTRCRVRVLEESRRGAAAARNRGLASATGEIIAFTDSDCSPARDWLAHLMAPFSEEAVCAAAGGIVSAPPSSTLQLFSALYTLRLPDFPGRHHSWTPRAGGFPTANFAVRRDEALKLEGFHADVVLYGEDYDFCARLYARGGTIAYTPRALVTHHHRDRLTGFLRQAFGFGRGQAYMMRRHGRGLVWIDLPLRPLCYKHSSIASWIDLSSADKKLLILALSGTVHPYLLWTMPLYGAYLVYRARQRGRRANARPSLPASVELAVLLVLKSAAMTAGRWWGSLIYRTLCV